MQITQLNLATEMIDLGVGQPDPTLLPLEIMNQAAAHRLSRADASFLQYGTEPGNGYFRRELAGFLGREWRMPVDFDRLFITNGATSGLDLICTHFAQPGDTVFVEEPSYFLALRVLADRRLKAVGIPIDGDGLIIDAVEEKLQHHRPAFLYTVPTFHNPTGVTLPAARRDALVRLAEKHGFYVVADEVYHLLAYTAAPPPPLSYYDRTGTVLSLGSFSKILAPGLRLGWILAAPENLQRLTRSGVLQSGGGLNPFTSAVVQSAIELGLQRNHLERLIGIYGQRAQTFLSTLKAALPDLTVFREPRGGFFVWLQLPERLDAAALRPGAAKRNVNFQPGANFSCCGGLHNAMRLCFVYYDKDRLIEGVHRLAKVLTARDS
jgi:DNA-binding transcriptional MocR family regulator